MLLDWFSHLDGTMLYGGRDRCTRYLAWHPLDHVRWELARPAPGGGAAEGARFRIVEVFGARPEYAVDVVDRVEKLDETGIRLVHARRGRHHHPARAHVVARRPTARTTSQFWISGPVAG